MPKRKNKKSPLHKVFIILFIIPFFCFVKHSAFISPDKREHLFKLRISLFRHDVDAKRIKDTESPKKLGYTEKFCDKMIRKTPPL